MWKQISLSLCVTYCHLSITYQGRGYRLQEAIYQDLVWEGVHELAHWEIWQESHRYKLPPPSVRSRKTGCLTNMYMARVGGGRRTSLGRKWRKERNYILQEKLWDHENEEVTVCPFRGGWGSIQDIWVCSELKPGWPGWILVEAFSCICLQTVGQPLGLALYLSLPIVCRFPDCQTWGLLATVELKEHRHELRVPCSLQQS